MKYKAFLGSMLAALFFCSTLGANLPISNSTLKKRVLSDLDCLQNMFEVKYAPKLWKEQFSGWQLDQAIQEAKNKISNKPAPSLKECQIVLRDFFNSTRDYHVGVRFYSTESASLPFLVKGTQGRYFVCYVDRDQITRKEFPFEIGDELLTFGNQPIALLVDQLRSQEFGDNTFETDLALAELSLTHRRGDMGHVIPQGKIEITGIKKRNKNRVNKIPTSAILTWSYVPEKIRDFSRLGVEMESSFLGNSGQTEGDLSAILKKSQFFKKFMVSHLWDKSSLASQTEMNQYGLGAKTSYIPALGRKSWKADEDAIFDAYIFETPSGKKIGYIRIPHYIGDEEEVEEFGLTMNLFQRKTDALVIDQLNNPGGSVFYLYGLAATLTDEPLHTPKHQIALTQEEVYIAHLLLNYLDKVKSEDEARKLLGDNLGGYPIDLHFVKLMRQFCDFLVTQWEEGKLFSDPTHLFGVDDILPHPEYRYTKPIVLLVNSLDFSGGDFFPAILQDNQRATIFGTRTAGAGGYVLSTSYPNHSGIKGFVMTGSLAKRVDQQPIENLGVVPDIQYDLSVGDLQENYHDYIDALLHTIDSLDIEI